MGAIQQQLFRKQISSQEASTCHYYFQKNLNQGTYTRISFQGEEYSHALQLVQVHTAAIGCRTLDILHVALALLLGVGEFVTCHARQKLLAEKVGIKVIFFK